MVVWVLLFKLLLKLLLLLELFKLFKLVMIMWCVRVPTATHVLGSPPPLPHAPRHRPPTLPPHPLQAGGVMAGMHRDKGGASAACGFLYLLALLKPKVSPPRARVCPIGS